ncbi:MAG TPA: SDR family oxidoreductase [Tepidisphaeraceae bacterium]|nr:SDR family oxidoreductase [Tepidisphaeraceae bacterium]
MPGGREKFAVVAGAGSGVGRAAAIRLLREGWSVALVGRREAPLRETANLAGAADTALIRPCDISDNAAVEKLAADVLAHFGKVNALVHAAGTNIPKRGWDALTAEDYRQVIDTNLNGAFYCVRAVLPAMRKQGHGTIVLIVSDAGIIANAKAGPAYVASKFAERGLAQSINAEERGNGVRCCAICPGDINTAILDKRPVPPPPDAREKMLQPEDVADCILLAINLPLRAVVEEIVVRPR